MFLLAGTIIVAMVWVGRQVHRAIAGLPLNVPKYLLLAAAIPMHWIVLLTPMPHKPIAIVAILTIYHNLQYHRLIWFHNQKYCRKTAGVRAVTPALGQGVSDVTRRDLQTKYGAAELISRRLLFYVAFGIVFGLVYQGPRQYLGYVGFNQRGSTGALSEPAFATQLGISFLWGYAFIHYYLDSKIWRVRRDPSVGKALKMD
jgi:hypothetical protein